MIEAVSVASVVVVVLLCTLSVVYVGYHGVHLPKQRETKCMNFDRKMDSIPWATLKKKTPPEALPIILASVPEATVVFTDFRAYRDVSEDKKIGEYFMEFETKDGTLTLNFRVGNGFCPPRPKWGLGS
jgi:hypothetical protein